jgi:hypothetical protein
VEQLIAELGELAKARTGYSAAETKDYLINAGARLWQELIPERLRQQFWDRQHRIRQLTIWPTKMQFRGNCSIPWILAMTPDSLLSSFL